MEDGRTVTRADPAVEHAIAPTSQQSGRWWAAPSAAILIVVCCAGPLLLGALVASGVGGWLAAHGFLLGATAVMVAAAFLALAAWMRTRAR